MFECNLTAAERRVLNLVSQAKSNKEIAVVLHISPATVKRHLENILRKLRLRNRVEAAIYGLIIMDSCCPAMIPKCPLQLWREAILKDGCRLESECDDLRGA